MISFLETERAKAEAEAMALSIMQSGSYSFPPSPQYPFSPGEDNTTFGVMIVRTPGGGERVLRSFSGFLNSSPTAPGYVNPCFSRHAFDREAAVNDGKIHDLTARINEGDTSLAEERKALTRDSLERIRALYSVSTWDGRSITMPERAPSGTGDCAGLRLINTALRSGWEMKGLAEFSLSSSGRPCFHPPCEERCGLLLPQMLGLNIIYADSSVAVINKEAGMLSVPGRGEEKKDSASYRFHRLFPSSPEVCHTHRLDMDTSGLLVMAFTRDAHRSMSMQFENKEVKKEYEALLEGVITENEGVIDAPMRLDVDNRPYQIVDPVQGKKAVTRWKRIRVEVLDGRKCTRVRFMPETGRTHQLRVHSAHIGHPIIGDRLYGTRAEGERLMLHASSITFRHPDTGENVSFSSSAPF